MIRATDAKRQKAGGNPGFYFLRREYARRRAPGNGALRAGTGDPVVRDGTNCTTFVVNCAVHRAGLFGIFAIQRHTPDTNVAFYDGVTGI